jgi:phosphoglycolate phosphatase
MILAVNEIEDHHGSGCTVGFDLDMTLADGRPGIRAVLERVADEYGVSIDTDLAMTRVGPPIEEELAYWLPENLVHEAADRYRALFPEFGATAGVLLPGAREAFEAVRALGGGVIVVTGKFTENARLNLASLGLEPDAVYGSVFAERKGEVLREQKAAVYVGDHTADILGAHAGGAVAVAVATGPFSERELREAGADVVLADLTEFPAWITEFERERSTS